MIFSQRQCCVITSYSVLLLSANRLFQQPLRDFVVLLGASNLRVSLEFGVQHMELDEIIVHEDYQLNSRVHANNIGERAVPPTVYCTGPAG